MVDAGSQAQQWLMGSGKAVCRVTMTGDSCCAADLAVGLPKIWQPGILLHHAPLPILRIGGLVPLSCLGWGKRGRRKATSGTVEEDDREVAKASARGP